MAAAGRDLYLRMLFGLREFGDSTFAKARAETSIESEGSRTGRQAAAV
jgi:hypothetical protein